MGQSHGPVQQRRELPSGPKAGVLCKASTVSFHGRLQHHPRSPFRWCRGSLVLPKQNQARDIHVLSFDEPWTMFDWDQIFRNEDHTVPTAPLTPLLGA